ncbi:MAG: hypothetical protein ACK48H_08015 [Microcystis sp.]|uniref:hypothetical protein n=1 Tax=Microcystis sp. TaxID=1127 RepID=UPI00391C0163
MRNVNLNILKFLASINNFCLSLANIGLGVSHQLSVISYQLSVISHQSSVSAFFSLLPAPISPRNAHEVVSPLPISLLQKNIKFY